MKLTYDENADAVGMYFRTDRPQVAQYVEASPYVVVHLDDQGRPVGIELLGVSNFVAAPNAVELKGVTPTAKA